MRARAETLPPAARRGRERAAEEGRGGGQRERRPLQEGQTEQRRGDAGQLVGHRPGQEAGDRGAQQQVARMRGRGSQRRHRARPHTRTLSFRAASFFSPMPGTWSSSETDRKPPCACR